MGVAFDTKGNAGIIVEGATAAGASTPGPGVTLYGTAANGLMKDQAGAFSTTNLKGGVIGITSASGTSDGKIVNSATVSIGDVGLGATKGASYSIVDVATGGKASPPTSPCTGRSCLAPDAIPAVVPSAGCTGRSCTAIQ